MSFRALDLNERVLRAIQDAGYTEPTPIQAAAIPLILGGHDLIGIAQTGTGKTAAFTLPLLTRLSAAAPTTGPGAGPDPSAPVSNTPHEPRGIRALVLAPTRELVVQIDENVRAYARHLPLRLALIYGGVGEHPQIQALRHADIAIATPGRLLDLMSRGFANFSALRMLVLDEADRMLDMGFLPDIRRVVAALPPKRQTLLFSATLSREIEDVTRQFLRAPKMVQIGRRANPAETVTQFVYEVPHQLKTTLLVHLLRDTTLNMVLVFSRTKHGADRVARQLDQQGIRTATLHSNRSQSQRLRALKDFKSGAVRVLVATDLAARGIDVDGISHVVNYDFPPHAEDYVHRIGRTGRAHAVGDAISFVTPDDHGSLRYLERFIGRGLIRKRAENLNETVLQFTPVPPQRPAHAGHAAPPPARDARDSQERRGPRHGPRQDGQRQDGQRQHGERTRFAPEQAGGRPTHGPRQGKGQPYGSAHRPPSAPVRGRERGQPLHSGGGASHGTSQPSQYRPQSKGSRQPSNIPPNLRNLSNGQNRGRDEARPQADGKSSLKPRRPWPQRKWQR